MAKIMIIARQSLKAIAEQSMKFVQALYSKERQAAQTRPKIPEQKQRCSKTSSVLRLLHSLKFLKDMQGIRVLSAECTGLQKDTIPAINATIMLTSTIYCTFAISSRYLCLFHASSDFATFCPFFKMTFVCWYGIPNSFASASSSASVSESL